MTLAAHLPGAFRWQFGRRSSQTGEKQTTEEGGLQERYLFRFSRSRNKTATTTGPPLRRARARPAAPPPPPPTRPGVRHFPIGALLGVKPLRVKRERCKEERERRERGGLPPCRLPSLCGCGANVTKRLREKVCTIYKSGGGGAGRGRTDAVAAAVARRRARAAVERLCSQRQCSGGSGGKVAAGVVPVGGDGGGEGAGGKLAARALGAISCGVRSFVGRERSVRRLRRERGQGGFPFRKRPH